MNKNAFVPDAGSITPTGTASSKAVPKSPKIGQRASTRPVSPAAIKAQQAVPTPPVTQPQVPKLPPSSMPTTALTKAAEGCGSVKRAPRYKSQARTGKKVMPLPHATQMKKANAAQEFATKLANTIPMEKQALGGIGTLIGAILGGTRAPAGNKMEGIGRGGGQGLGWDVGGSIGLVPGATVGSLAGSGVGALLSQIMNGDWKSGASLGALGGGLSGGTVGYLGGGMLGRQTAKGMMGNPTWQQPQRKDESVGDNQADNAQMVAP